jgi:hypothetical protein
MMFIKRKRAPIDEVLQAVELSKMREALKEARDYIQSVMKLVHRQRAQEALKAIDAALDGKAAP